MKRRDVLAGGAAAAMSMGLARPSLAQKAQVLRYVPQAGLANPDPIWTTATVASLHGYMVWDTLYGIDEGLIPRLQMLQAADTSSDGLTWNFKLREGLFWTDGEPVRSIDCITSIKRWARRDGFGQRLLTQTVDMKVVDDKTFQIILNKPYPLLPYALGGGSTGCFIMPERISKTDPFTQITEYVGSGPYRFLDKEWVSGASAAWAKNDKYVPRSEPPSYFAGGKVANFDRVEWVTMDPSTASGALQKGEVDWWENPIFDLLPQLRKDPNLTVNVLSALGAVGVVAFNHTQPPFDNPKLLQALIPSFSQQDIIDAVLGDQASGLSRKCGFFTPGSPYATEVGRDALLSPRDLARSKQLVAESGYKGEPIVLMAPSDQPQLLAMALVVDSFYKSLGLNSQYTVMDWGTLVARRASHEPSSKGGWNSFCTTWGGLSVSNPGGSYPLRGNGKDGWFGWPTDARMESLRDAWFDAPDLAAQKKICDQIQMLAFENVPIIPTGQWFSPTAYRKNLTGFVKSDYMLFWGVKRV
jgi:peptide/nickel transport system substrate-binding protein